MQWLRRHQLGGTPLALALCIAALFIAVPVAQSSTTCRVQVICDADGFVDSDKTFVRCTGDTVALTMSGAYDGGAGQPYVNVTGATVDFNYDLIGTGLEFKPTAPLTIRDSTFQKGVAAGELALKVTGGSATLRNVTFSTLDVSFGGSALVLDSTTADLQDVHCQDVLGNCLQLTASVATVTGLECASASVEGCIRAVQQSSLTASGITFSGMQLHSYPNFLDGNTMVDSVVLLQDGTTASFDNCHWDSITVAENATASRGVCLDSRGSTVSLTSCTFTSIIGSAVQLEQSASGTFVNCTWDGSDAGTQGSYQDRGVALDVQDSTVTVNSSRIRNIDAQVNSAVMLNNSAGLFSIVRWTDNSAQQKYSACLSATTSSVLVQGGEFTRCVRRGDLEKTPSGGAVALSTCARLNSTGGLVTLQSRFEGVTFTGNEYLNGSAIGATNCALEVIGGSFTLGVSNGIGSALWVRYGSLVAQSAEFADNTAVFGGAVALYDLSAAIRNCTFRNNTGGQSGAILAMGGGNGRVLSTLTVNNCKLRGNKGGTVGAIFIQQQNFNGYNSDFTGNIASQGNGGAVYITNCMTCAPGDAATPFALTTFLTNSTFTSNTAGSSGGAVFHTGVNGDPPTNPTAMSRIIVRNCTFNSNQANGTSGAGSIATLYSTVFIVGSSVSGSRATRNAGVVLSNSFGNNTVQNTNFSDNACSGSSQSVSGGALTASSEAGVASALLLIQGCRFERNNCSVGGALQLFRTTTTILDSLFSANNASQNGGAIALMPDNTITGTHVITPDPASGLQMQRVHFENNWAKELGGAITTEAWRWGMTDCEFVNNTGGSSVAGSAIYASPCAGKCLIYNTNFTGNVADRGALYLDSCNTSFVNSTFTNNFAATVGGGINANSLLDDVYMYLSMDSCYFNGNSANQSGGGLVLNAVALQATNTTFEGNTARLVGGALQLFDVSRSSKPDIKDNATLSLMLGRIESCTFLSNSAADSGGAIYMTNSLMDINGSRFNGNHAGDGVTNDDWSDSGGGIHSQTCVQVTLAHTTFDNNYATGAGGAFTLLDCTLSVNECAFTNNSAGTWGGAVATAHRKQSFNDDVTVSAAFVSTNFTGNQANPSRCGSVGSPGGAIYASEIDLRLYTCNVVNNSAGSDGGGIYAQLSSTLSLQSTLLKGNKCDRNGGAVHSQDAGDVIIEEVKFVDNYSTRRGGAMLLQDPSCTYIMHTEFVNNSASMGGCITLEPLPPSVTDSSNFCPVDSATVGGIRCPLLLANSLTEAGVPALASVSKAGNDTIAEREEELFVFMHNVSASDNYARDFGGGMLLVDAGYGAVVLDSVRFVNNSAVGQSKIRSTGADGGALQLQHDEQQGQLQVQLYVVSSQLDQNKAAKGAGGAVAVSSVEYHQQVVLLNSTLTGNSARVGGAVAVQQNSSVAVQGCTFEGNTASEKGGAVWAQSCNEIQLVNGSSFRGCSATDQGGAVAVDGCAHVLMKDVTMSANMAQSGGAIVLDANSGCEGTNGNSQLAVLLGIQLANNSATGVSPTGQTNGLGGGLLVTGQTSVFLSSSKFDGNSAEGLGGSLAFTSQCDVDALTARFALQRAGQYVPPPPTPTVIPNITAFTGMDQQIPDTLTALDVSTDFGCWRSIMHMPVFVRNKANSSGGAAFVTEVQSVALVCDIPAVPVRPTLQDVELKTIISRGFDRQAITTVGFTNESLSGCIPKASDNDTTVLGGNVAAGYGPFIALVPSRLRLGGLSKAVVSAVNQPGSATSRRRMQSGTNPILGGNSDPAADTPTELTANITDQRGLRLLITNGVSASGTATRQYSMLVTSNQALDVQVLLYDALDQLADDKRVTSVPGPTVRATIDGQCKAEIVGSREGNSYHGVANINGLRVQAPKGLYTLNLSVLNPATTAGVTPLQINLTIPPCALGEVPKQFGTICERCDKLTFSLWEDVRPLNNCLPAVDPDSKELPICYPCPDNGVCTGGPVMVPDIGYWHSAANSTVMHPCPNPSACRDDDGGDELQAALQACQEAWYGVPEGADPLSLVIPDNFIGSVTNSSFLLDCALWGVSNQDPRAYMSRQCAEGYSGNLCAVCTSVSGKLYANSQDFECGECFNKAASVTIAILGFLANLIIVFGTILITFLDDYVEDDDEVEVSDIIKVLIVHMQFFVIITRLNIEWPSSITTFTAIVASVTGTVKQTYSPSCLLNIEDATPETQAKVEVLASLVTPGIVVVVVLLMWLFRYQVWNFRKKMQRTSGGRRSGDGLAELFQSGNVHDLEAATREASRTISMTNPVGPLRSSTAAAGRQPGSPLAHTHSKSELGQGSSSSADLVATASRGEHPHHGKDGADPSAVYVGMDGEHRNGHSQKMSPLGLEFINRMGGLPQPNLAQLRSSTMPHDKGPGDTGSPAAAVQAAHDTRSFTQPKMPFFSAADDQAPHEPNTFVGGSHSPRVANSFAREPTGLKAWATSLFGKKSTASHVSNNPTAFGGGVSHPDSPMAASVHSQAVLYGRPTAPGDIHMPDSPKPVYSQEPGGDRPSSMKPEKALAVVDNTMGLRQQLFLVLFVSCFILYPAWAQATLSIFACYNIDDGSGLYAGNQLATEPNGYWIRNMNQACYKGSHATLWLPIGICCIFVLCAGIPATIFGVLWAHRTKLKENYVLQTYGFLYTRYVPKFYYWESVVQLQTLALVIVDVFGRTLPVYQQAVLLQVVLVIIMVMNMYFRPVKYPLLVQMEFLSLGVLSITVSMGLFFVNPQGSQDLIANSSRVLVGAIILILNAGLVLYYCWIVFHHGWPVFLKALSKTRRRVQRFSSKMNQSATATALKAYASRISRGLSAERIRGGNWAEGARAWGARAKVKMTGRPTMSGDMGVELVDADGSSGDKLEYHPGKPPLP